MLVLFVATTQGTFIKRIVKRRLFLMGGLALAVVLVIAGLQAWIVLLSTYLFKAEWLWITKWVVFLLTALTVPSLLLWRREIRLIWALLSLGLMGIFMLLNWLNLVTMVLMTIWLHACVTLLIPNVRTVDWTRHGSEILVRLKTRFLARFPLHLQKQFGRYST